jgi:hypothetical protein
MLIAKLVFLIAAHAQVEVDIPQGMRPSYDAFRKAMSVEAVGLSYGTLHSSCCPMETDLLPEKRSRCYESL